MQSLFSLPILDDLLAQGKYAEALMIVNEAVEVLGPHLHGRFPPALNTTPEEALVLSKLYLVQRDYGACVRSALVARDILHRLDRFYYDAVVYRMMEYLLEHGGDAKKSTDGGSFVCELKAFVLDFIKEDETGDSLLGYLAEIGEFGILKEKILGLSKTEVDCKNVLNVLLDEYYDEIYEVFFDVGAENPCMLNYVIEAFICANRLDDLSGFLSKLPWSAMYAACFYIEDTHHIKLRLSNENANFILSGDWKQEIMSNFMLKNTKTSFKFLESMSKARAPYISLCNCIMNAGTTNDTLYRNNKGLLTGREWVRFLEYAPIGMIHQGNINAFEILKEMLPSFESNSGEPASLMALGSMNARSCDKETTDFLLNWLESTSDEVVFGACMGLGLNLLESGDKAVYERLRALFSVDSTITQESALYAIGMLFAGTDDEEVLDFLHTVQAKSDFPRVKRVCGLATALVCIYGCRDEMKRTEGASEDDAGYFSAEEASTDGDSGKKEGGSDFASTHFDFLKSNDAAERETAILSLGTAFIATSNLSIIKRILPFINDGDDDVKRSSVIAIALIGYEDANITSSCLVPLAQNHNLHVRAAAALVLGLFNCGTGDTELCALLEAMLYDSDDLVRQAAAMGVGFALVQMNPSLVPNYKRILDRLNSVLVAKGESACAKIGAAIGRAVAEAGGRAAIFSLGNFSHSLEVKRIVGAVLFLQSWYWYPLMGCLSLCLLPTPIFFFDENLDETDHVLTNDPKFYDYLVRIPEVRRSRKFKAGRDTDVRDVVSEAPKGLRSGSRLTDLERSIYGLECGVIFKK